MQEFQSTLLMRGATIVGALGTLDRGVFQSTLLMRGATDSNPWSVQDLSISIHAPHARSDETYAYTSGGEGEFQSTLLMRGATCSSCGAMRLRRISIHAPHARSDTKAGQATLDLTNFNPRSSCEERRAIKLCSISTPNFNPRSSCEERLVLVCAEEKGITNFNPRSSCEERRLQLALGPLSMYFNPRSSCEERRMSHDLRSRRLGFQSTLLMRGATK